LELIQEAELTNRSITMVELIKRENIRALGDTFSRLNPVDETPCFDALLYATDEADKLGCRLRS